MRLRGGAYAQHASSEQQGLCLGLLIPWEATGPQGSPVPGCQSSQQAGSEMGLLGQAGQWVCGPRFQLGSQSGSCILVLLHGLSEG